MYMDKKGRQGISAFTESGPRESPFDIVDGSKVERNRTAKKEGALTSSKGFEEYRGLFFILGRVWREHERLVPAILAW
jgi:hypothetical protein